MKRRRGSNALIVLPLLCLVAFLLQTSMIGNFDSFDFLFLVEEPTRSIPDGVYLTPKEQVEAKEFCNFSFNTQKNALEYIQIQESPPPRIKILCYVHTISSFQHKSQAVRDTWGPKCDKLIFISNTTAEDTVDIPLVAYDHKHLWDKSRKSFRFLQKHYPDYDWYYKADDDTYLIMENMRAYLAKQSLEEPLLLGHRFMLPDTIALKMSRNASLWEEFSDRYGPWIYPSGGSGYAMNKVLLDNIVQHLDKPYCFPEERHTVIPEDAATAFCARYAGADIPETRDRTHRQRFHFTNPGNTLRLGAFATEDNWINNYHYGTGGLQAGRMAISKESVAFHYNKPPWMYYLDSQLYHCHRYETEEVPVWFRDLLYDLEWVKVYSPTEYDKLRDERKERDALLLSNGDDNSMTELESGNADSKDEEVYERPGE